MSNLFIILLSIVTSSLVCGHQHIQFEKGVPYIPHQHKVVIHKAGGTVFVETFSLLNTEFLKVEDSKIIAIENGALCGNFPKLELRHNELPEFTGNVFGNRCATLKHLKLSNNVDLVIPETAFSSLPNLEVLEILVQKNFTRVTSALLAKLTSLRELTIGFSALEVIEPRALDSLTNLRKLLLFNNKLTSIDGTLSKLSNLEFLNLESNKIKVFPIEELRRIPSLKSLNMQNNYDIKSGVYASEISQALPNLKYINIQLGFRDCSILEDILKGLFVSLPGIEAPFEDNFHLNSCYSVKKKMYEFIANLRKNKANTKAEE